MFAWEEVLTKVIPTVITLEKAAETWFNRPKSGEQKKAFVHNSTIEIFKTAKRLTTGGAHHTIEVLEKHLPDLIDTTASVLFAAKSNKERNTNKQSTIEPDEKDDDVYP